MRSLWRERVERKELFAICGRVGFFGLWPLIGDSEAREKLTRKTYRDSLFVFTDSYKAIDGPLTNSLGPILQHKLRSARPTTQCSYCLAFVVEQFPTMTDEGMTLRMTDRSIPQNLKLKLANSPSFSGHQCIR